VNELEGKIDLKKFEHMNQKIDVIWYNHLNWPPLKDKIFLLDEES